MVQIGWPESAGSVSYADTQSLSANIAKGYRVYWPVSLYSFFFSLSLPISAIRSQTSRSDGTPSDFQVAADYGRSDPGKCDVRYQCAFSMIGAVNFLTSYFNPIKTVAWTTKQKDHKNQWSTTPKTWPESRWEKKKRQLAGNKSYSIFIVLLDWLLFIYLFVCSSTVIFCCCCGWIKKNCQNVFNSPPPISSFSFLGRDPCKTSQMQQSEDT